MAEEKLKGWKLLKTALKTRKSATMLAFGFSSGLPYALLIGTLNAWLGEVGIKLATIGVLSWIGLAYSFKFLWSPIVDRYELPVIGKIGRRKSWIALCQVLMVLAFIGLVLTNPTTNIGLFATFAFIAAFGSSTQDVAVDAWRIDVADEEAPITLLSTIYQFGYKTASIVGGAFALFLAGRMAWPVVFLLMAVLIGIIVFVTLRAPDTPRPDSSAAVDQLAQPGEIEPKTRAFALAVVGAFWIWAIATIGHFMVLVLQEQPVGVKPPSATDFTKLYGPWIVAATVVVPLVVAATMNWLKARGRNVLTAVDTTTSPVRSATNHLYSALVSPLAELTGRLGWGVLILIGLILTYQLCFNVWSSFAYPFYLEQLKYTKDQVAFASKIFGIFMTIIGVSTAGYLFARIGIIATMLVGAIVPIFGNLLFADLADGGANIDAFANLFGLNALAGSLGFDPKMVRLMLAITGENIATGIAGAAFVAYVSGVVSKNYTAVQYALLSSLTFLIGSLGRGMAGENIQIYGYGTVFRVTALLGVVSAVFVLLEWARSKRAEAALPAQTGS